MSFSEAELEVVAARKLFSWEFLGIESGQLSFRVTNGSTRTLPFLSIGIRADDFIGGVWLDVSELAPGETRALVHEPYDFAKPDAQVPFALPQPVPATRDRYWEFKGTQPPPLDGSELEDALRPLVREASLARGDPEAAAGPLTSHAGGTPYLEVGEAWPCCGDCGLALDFVCQVNFADCVHADRPEGLATFYFCNSCVPWGLDDESGEAWCLKIYQKPSEQKFVSQTPPLQEDEDDVFVEPLVMRFDLVTNVPDLEEGGEIESIASLTTRVEDPWESYASAVEALGCDVSGKTQVGGYARWVQSEDVPSCSCGQSMSLLIQIDSDDDFGFMWGDLGRVYLFACTECEGEFAYALQCC